MADPKSHKYEDIVKGLSNYYATVKRQILCYQSPTTGLYPCNLEDPAKKNESHVRDSIYCASATWALSQAFKRIDDDKGKTYELCQSTVKCMRGILACWISQAEKVEKFKYNQSPKNALHSRFHMITGDPINSDDEYEHLQIDCVALYLIFLVQMIHSGLQIIYTTDEVNFIQNLVFYVERAYRTPDYGMWERGSKYNNGSSELHASSVGLCKAALEAVSGVNLYGAKGTASSVVFIDIDAYHRNRTILTNLLPRESVSKNTDASLISTNSWPTFAIHDDSLRKKTLDKVIRRLQGNYGLKRFLRDGYRTVLEDRNRKYYRPAEIKTFDGIECEWPMFYIYLIIDKIFKGDQEGARHYQELLKPRLKYSNNGYVVPKYYYVRQEDIEGERKNPGSQTRVASSEGENGNLFLWGQSVYIISQLLMEGFLQITELDAIGRNLPAAERTIVNTRYSSFQSSPSDLVIQVVLIAESAHLQSLLATYGIQTQTPHQIEPIEIWPPGELAKAYEQLGVNKKLGLTGRPPRPIGGLGTAKIYRACGLTFICYPLLFEISDFYLSHDMSLAIDDIKSDLSFLAKCWKLSGRPTFCMAIREDNMRGPDARQLFHLLAQFKRGDCDGIKVRVGRMQEFISSACTEHLDFLEMNHETHPFKPLSEVKYGKAFRSLQDIPSQMEKEKIDDHVDVQWLQQQSTHELRDLIVSTESLMCQAHILHILMNREGLYYKVHDECTVEERLERLYHTAGSTRHWSAVRFCASLLGKLVDSLAPSITAILVRGKQITIGVFGREEEVVDKPLSPHEIKNIVYAKCFPYDITQAVLQQEMILDIGKFVSSQPDLFNGILKIRIGWMLRAMELELNYGETQEESIYRLSPSSVKNLMLQVLQKTTKGEEPRTPIWRRQLDGALNRVPKYFYDYVWKILERTPGGLKVAGYHLPQQPTLSDMTMYELNFSLLVEQMLSRIVDPAYRQIMVETFMVVATILHRNPELEFSRPVDMDKLVCESFDMFQKDRSKSGEEKQDNMNAFYNSPPNTKNGTTTYIARAVVNSLLQGEVRSQNDESCSVS